MRSYDVKWVEAQAEGIGDPKFEDQHGKSKPLIVLMKCGLEVARMGNGANGNELARLVEANCGDKKAA